MTLNECGKKDCKPVLQTRGKMGEGDYKDIELNHEAGRGPKGAETGKDAYKFVELFDETIKVQGKDVRLTNKEDLRVCCMTCGLATPWANAGDPVVLAQLPDEAREKLVSAVPGGVETAWNKAVARAVVAEKRAKLLAEFDAEHGVE